MTADALASDTSQPIVQMGSFLTLHYRLAGPAGDVVNTFEGKPATLSSSEFALLKIFVNHALRTLTRERLLELLHGPEYDGTDRGIDVQVWCLRRILETDPSTPRFIQTVRGRGYVFVPDGEAHAQTH